MPSKALEKYLLNYKGIADPHLHPLKVIQNMYDLKKVLYPGCWIHLTPSLVFPFVVYVDFFAKMESMLNDPELIQYIQKHSKTKVKPIIKFHKADYRDGINEEKASFDLLISLSSGFVSQYCRKYLKKKGLLFVNNEHYDATKAYVDKNFLPIGVFTFDGKLIQQNNAILEYFLTKKDQVINSEMVLENSKKSPSKAKFKLKKTALASSSSLTIFIRSLKYFSP